MRCNSSSIILAMVLVALATGCQHIPPAPLDMEAYARALSERPLDMAPVRAYAEALGRARESEPMAFDLDDGVSLAEAEAVALTFNGAIRMARLEAEHAALIAHAAGRWVDPEIGLAGGRKRTEGGARTREFTLEPSAESPTGASYGIRQEVERSIERAWVRSASLSITIPTSGRLGAERRARGASYEAALRAVAETEWRTLLEVRMAWLDWSGTVERLAMIDAQLEVLEPFVAAAEALRAAGELLPADARLFAIEHGRLAAHGDRIRHEVGARRAAILLLMGLLPEAPVELEPSLAVTAAVDAVPDLPRRLARTHPVLARLRADYQVAEERLRVEVRRQYPDITLSPLYTDEQDETSLVLGLGFPLPVWNANRLGIAEAAAARDLARARIEQAFEQVVAETVQAQAVWAGAQAQRLHLAERVAPMVDLQLEELQTLLRVGEADLAMIHQALLQALDIKAELLEAALAEQVAMATVSAALTPAWTVSIETGKDLP